MRKITIVLLFIGLSVSYGYDNSNQKQMRQPPAEAITICKGKNSGESCSITTPKGDSINGMCEDTPDGKYFACKPEMMGNDKPPRR